MGNFYDRKLKIRRSWTRNPETQIVENGKTYKRSKIKRELLEEIQEFNEEDFSDSE